MRRPGRRWNKTLQLEEGLHLKKIKDDLNFQIKLTFRNSLNVMQSVVTSYERAGKEGEP
jgi:hypothetical protein